MELSEERYTIDEINTIGDVISRENPKITKVKEEKRHTVFSFEISLGEFLCNIPKIYIDKYIENIDNIHPLNIIRFGKFYRKL